jgi:hypothetical protein
MRKIEDFNNFSEAMRTKDLSSIPGKEPGDSDYISSVTDRAKKRLGIEGEREGNVWSVAGPLMQELQKSTSLSKGHEDELGKLATQVINDLYKPIIDFYDIKLDIKIDNGREIRKMIDAGYEKVKSSTKNSPSQTPIIKARGADFSMLIHEAVKGIWRVMSMSSVPKDPELAKAIESQFDLRDEPDEWRYGPEIAADLRDFVNKNPKVDNYKNLREELWKYMVDSKNLPTEEFLSLMKGILSNTSEARTKLDSIIDEVIKEIEKRDKYFKDLERYKFEMAEYERKMEEYRRKKEAQTKISSFPDQPKGEETEYSKMSQKQLNDELSIALDSRDFEKVKEISKYLK